MCRKEIAFQQKPSEKADFIVKMTGPAMVRPASSEKWKAPLVCEQDLHLGVSLEVKRERHAKGDARASGFVTHSRVPARLA